MNADQGFRRAPGNLLRVAAGAGAAALIAAAVSAARRARTATADRDSGSAPTRYPHQTSRSPRCRKRSRPATRPSARSRSAPRCCSSVSPRCRPSLAVAGAAASEAPRTRGHRDARLRTGMTSSRRRYLPTAAIPGSRAPRGAAARSRPGTTPISPGMTACAASTRMTTPAGPGAQARTLSTPITRAGGEGVPTRAGIARRRRCGRTATPAGRSPRPRRGPTPNRRRRTTVPAGAAEDPRDKNRRPRLTAARPARLRSFCGLCPPARHGSLSRTRSAGRLRPSAGQPAWPRSGSPRSGSPGRRSPPRTGASARGDRGHGTGPA